MSLHEWGPVRLESTKDRLVDAEECARCGCILWRGEVFKDEKKWWHSQVACTAMCGNEYASEDCDLELIRSVLNL